MLMLMMLLQVRQRGDSEHFRNAGKRGKRRECMATTLFSGEGRSELRHTLSSWLIETWYSTSRSTRLGPFRLPLLLGSRFYARGLCRDQRQARLRARRLPAFVVSVGNLVAGGTGKTPFTLWLAEYFRAQGRHPAILSRGYGRRGSEIALVPSKGEASAQVPDFGDEPILMARKAPAIPVWVGRTRWKSGQAAIQYSGADVLILDDGLQHLSLERDLDLVLLDAHNPFGNGALLPLGPLREPVEHLDRAHAILLTRADDPEKVHATLDMLRKRFPGKPLFSCRHRPTGLRIGLSGSRAPLEALRGQSAIAFAGIARPEAFFRSLRAETSIRLDACVAFPDHHSYKAADVARLLRLVRKNGARFLITTEKDIVRLPADIQEAVLSAELELDFGSDLDSLYSFLKQRVGGAAHC